MKTFDWHVGKHSFRMAFDTQFISDRNLLAYANSGTVPEPEVVNFMLRAIRPGDTVVDGGASIGFFTLLMSRLVGPTGKVFAFEPHPQTVHRLIDNVGFNELVNVQVHRRALSERECEATLYEHLDDGQSGLWGEGKKFKVQTIALDSLNLKPRLIKLDIEGSEFAALAGFEKTLKKYAPFVVCELNETALQGMQVTSVALRNRFRLHRYDTFLLPEHGEMPVWVSPDSELKTKRANTNVLFMPQARMSELYPVVEVP